MATSFSYEEFLLGLERDQHEGEQEEDDYEDDELDELIEIDELMEKRPVRH
jgi:hypothetical protein